MSYFVRKFTKAKWVKIPIDDNPFDIPSDVISIDLKTSENTLSVWEIEDETKLEQAVIAITSAGDRLDTIDIIWIEKQEFENKGVQYVQSPGLTPIKQFVHTHFDLYNLSYFKLGLVAESIAEKIKRGIQVRRFNKGELKKIYNNAITNGVLDKSVLKESISKDL